MRSLIFIGAIACLLVSCDDSIERPINDDSNDSLDAKPLIPLKLDNQWTYDYPGLYDRIVYWVDSTFTYTHQDSLIDMYAVKFTMGAGIYKHLYYKYNGALSRTMYWIIEPDNPEYCFRHPVNVGDRWTNEFKFYVGNYYYFDEYTLLSKNRPISVPGGLFYCYDYQIERTVVSSEGTDRYVKNYYFRPGVGLIAIKKAEAYSPITVILIETWQRRLVSHSLE